MTDRFLRFIPWILRWETVYNSDGSVRTEHDPDDPGGTTRYGIDARSHPGVDIASLSQPQATEIYYNEWVHIGAQDMAPNLGEVYFNACVNQGAGEANLILHRTTDAASFVDDDERVYRLIASEHPRLQKFLNGWLNRLNDLRKFLGL